MRRLSQSLYKISNALPRRNAVNHVVKCTFATNATTIPYNMRPVANFRRNFSVVKEPLESLGDSITTAVLLSWSKRPGDAIKEDDVIAVVETDKVTMEIRAKKTGVFVQGLADAGAEINVGADLYTMDTDGTAVVAAPAAAPAAAAPAAAAPAAAAPAAAPAAVPAAAPSTLSPPSAAPVIVNVPVMGDAVTQGVLAKWTVSPNQAVNADDVVASIETDKVTVDVRCPAAGTIDQLFAAQGDEVLVGHQLFSFSPGAGRVAAAPKADKAAAPAPAPVAAAPKQDKPSPVAAAAPSSSTKASAPTTGAFVPSKSAGNSDRTETRVKMTRMRQRIAQRLKESQNTAAMLTTFQEIDMSALINMRNKHKEEFEKSHKVKLGFMSAFVRASSAALQEIPAVNAVIDDATNEIVYRNYIDISVAVASPTGLVVPVLRNTQDMGFADVEKAIAFYGKKAKEGTMALEDMAGGTFTISNGGVFGSLYGTPIINPPQSAILGMHATKERAVVVNGQVVARPMMYVALTYDHRLIDGREAVTFLKSIQNKIEDPSRLLLDL